MAARRCDGAEHNHTWIRTGQEVRTAITVDGDGEWVVGGLKELVILKSTGSEFAGFLTDPYTVLEPTHDRVMATSLVALWRFTTPAGDWQVAWDEVYAGVKRGLPRRRPAIRANPGHGDPPRRARARPGWDLQQEWLA